jgi:hypothetical protein
MNFPPDTNDAQERLAVGSRAEAASTQPIRFAGSELGEKRHICAFFNSADEDPVIRAYDLTRFSGNVVVDLMRTHPMIIIDGILQENPFCVPPDEFLRELRERRASSGRTDAAAS